MESRRRIDLYLLSSNLARSRAEINDPERATTTATHPLQLGRAERGGSEYNGPMGAGARGASAGAAGQRAGDRDRNSLEFCAQRSLDVPRRRASPSLPGPAGAL